MLKSLLGTSSLAVAVGALIAGMATTTDATAAVRTGSLDPTARTAAAGRSDTTTARAALPAPTTKHHFVANVGGATRAARRWGFTVIDSGSSREEIRALPRGTQALVWLGQDCPTRANASFRRKVKRLAHNQRVFGYYLSDEPDVSSCPNGPVGLASRARFIRRASHHHQRSFIVMSDAASYHAYRPAVSRVSMVGLDPYPCSTAHPTCDFTKIREKVHAARVAGIPLDAIVPVYEAFGQERTSSHYYNIPTADQMTRMLARWAALVPHPRMDYAYSWGHQHSANPTLRDSNPLKQLFRTYFSG